MKNTADPHPSPVLSHWRDSRQSRCRRNNQRAERQVFVRVMQGIFASMLALLVGCESRNDYKELPPAKVTVAIPFVRPVQHYFETTGQTRAAQTVDLRARVGGYLSEISFKDGEMVEAGQKLFVIDQATYAAEVASAKADLNRAQAQLTLAQQQLARTSKLAREDAATESALDAKTADRASKVADVESAEAALREAELNLGYTVIEAPFAGRMGRHLVDLGNLVISGETLLATLESVDPMQAYFTLSEVDLLHFMEMQKEGKLRRITEADPLKLDLALGDTGDFRFHGQLDFRKFGINPSTGTTERRAVFPNDPAELLPGLFVRIRAAVGEPTQELLVDEQAVGRDQRGDYLLIVNDQNIVETRMVKLGSSQGSYREIESGIQKTDHVIVNGLQRARPGSTVVPELVSMDHRVTAAKQAETAEKKPAAANSKEPTQPATDQSNATPPPAPATREEQPAPGSEKPPQ